MLSTHRYKNLCWLSFPSLDACPELVHGVFTRRGGFSGPQGGELNLAFNEHEPPETVLANLRLVEEALALGPLAFVRQTHSDRVAIVRARDGYGPRRPEEVWDNYDALVAPEPGVGLLVKVADCQALILYDPQSRILGLVHSGWRGSVQNIIARTVETMLSLGAQANAMLAAISPSLGPCCAEFKEYRQQLPDHFQKFMSGPCHFDFWAISRQQLMGCGLKSENVTAAEICTRCSPDFFSYRRGDIWPRFAVAAAVRA